MSIVRSSIYNILGAAAPIAVSLMTVPLYLRVVGLERYGMLAICWLLLGYFSIFDFGLSAATAQRVAALKHGDPNERSEIVWTAIALVLGFSGLATLLFVPSADFSLRMLGVKTGALRSEVTASLPLLAATVPVGILNQVLVSALQGRESFLSSNLISTVSGLLSAVLPVVAATLISPHLPVLIAASLVARSSGIVALFLLCRRAVPLRRPSLAKGAALPSFIAFAGWTTVSNIVAPVLVVWDRFAVGALLGSAAVALYAIPMNLVWQVLIIPNSLVTALLPRLAAIELPDAQALAADSIRVLRFLMTPATVLGVGLAEPFLRLWLGAAHGGGTASVAAILALGTWTNAFARVPYALLQARGRPQAMALTHLAELLPYIGLLYLCLTRFGLEGAALVWSLRTTADAVVLFWLATPTRRTLLPLLADAALVSVAVAAVLVFPLASPLRWAVVLGATGVAVLMTWRYRPANLFATLLRRRAAATV